MAAQNPDQIMIGKPHQDGNVLVAKALTRTEPSQKQEGAWDVTTVTYLGPDLNGDLIPDKPPTKLDCQQKSDVVKGDAEVTNHKLTWQSPTAGAPPWNRVDVFVNSNGEVKNMLFTCQNTGEKVIAPNPKSKIEGVSEVWSANFAQKCITETSGVDLEINWVGFATSALKPKCTFSNDSPPSSQPCDVSNTVATPKPAAESGVMNPSVDFASVTNKRPTGTSKLVNQDFGQGPVDALIGSGCAFSETLKVWIRTDTISVIANTGPNAKNFGRVVLYLGTTSPTDPNDGTTCAIIVDDPGGAPDTVIFPSYLESHSRDATTDHPTEPKNALAITALALVQDPDGPFPKVKGVPQLPDSADGLQDDWDGDGCPDWDELDKSFINGRDPFNPNDCNVDDFTGAYSILATAFTAAKVGEITGTAVDVLGVVSKDQKFDPTAAENGPEHTCNNAVDDDGDGAINDGCPEVIPAAVTIDPTPAEAGAQCDNALDDDKDGFVNDGCPTVNTSPSESGAQCDNNIDDDKDGLVNDGCRGSRSIPRRRKLARSATTPSTTTWTAWSTTVARS